MRRGLNSLIGKGLISFIKEGKKRIYQAANPENFYDFIKDKKKRFKAIMPELKKKQSMAKTTSYTETYKGKRGINQLYITLLNSGGREYNTFGGGSGVTYDAMGESWWKSLHAKRLARKIRCRQVFDESIREFGNILNKKPLTN
ncbi:hypothetical protein GF323_05975 [Candidatus Woesearchaeota archaeon]|nr:hypothetical protein [Candidatus Woesearchaeota archaeon]